MGPSSIELMEILSRPEMHNFADYPRVAMSQIQTEIDTLRFLSQRVVSSGENGLIIDLNTSNGVAEKALNEKIKLIPRMIIQCRVSVKEKVAPLQLKFEYFDEETGNRIEVSDTIVCLSATNPCPSVEQCTKNDTSPRIMKFYD